MTEQTRDIYDLEAPFSYTIPVQKAFTGEDGRRRIVGAATGPEVDLQNERVHPSLIDKFIRQINEGAIPVVFKDWHKKDSITADLGVVEKAWKDDEGHMWIEAVLDDDNPVAGYLHKSAMPKERGGKGKKYGMSIGGKVFRFADEFVPELGRKVRTFYDGIIEEVSNTTAPAWSHSLGTVLSKAVNEEMSRTAEGDTSNVTEQVNVETPDEQAQQEVVDDAAAKETTDSGAATAPETQDTPEVADGSADAAVVEKAITADNKKDEKRLSKIVSLYTSLGEELRQSGLLAEETSSDEKTEVEATVEKSVDTDPRLTAIEKSLETLSAAVLAIAENVPAGTAPGLIRKSEEVDPISELRSVEDPMERLRMGFAALHGEGSPLR